MPRSEEMSKGGPLTQSLCDTGNIRAKGHFRVIVGKRSRDSTIFDNTLQRFTVTV